MRSLHVTRIAVASLALLGSACGNSDDSAPNGAGSAGAVAGSGGGLVTHVGGRTNSVQTGGRASAGDSAAITAVSGGGQSTVGGATGGGASSTDSPATGGGVSNLGGAAGASSTDPLAAVGGVSNLGGGVGATTGGIPSLGGVAGATTGGVPNLGGAAGATTGGVPNPGGAAGATTGGLSCGPRGGQGNTGGFGDELPPIAHECLVNAECTDGICFDGPHAQVLSCRKACDKATAGQQGSCELGQICVIASGGSRAGCLDQCEPFQVTETCRAGNWCYPVPHPSFTGGVSVAGLCIKGGSYTEGTRCPSGGCASGLLCNGPMMAAPGSYHCARPCNPEAGAGQVGACLASEICLMETAGRGACVKQCDPFGTDVGQCQPDQWCVPFHDLEAGNSVIRGHCVKTGDHPKGAPCQSGLCGKGLDCSIAPVPFQRDAAICRPFCKPSSAASCTPGERCIPYRTNGTPLEVGTCQKSCLLWESDPCAAGCASNEWCAPSNYDEGFGHCEPTAGIQPTGATCGPTAACSAGNQCLCRFDEYCISDKRCERLCSPSAELSEPGNCPAGEVCATESFSGLLLSFGICRQSCDYDVGVSCTDPAEACVPGELLSQGSDTCLVMPQRKSCTMAQPGDPCGPTDLCLTTTVIPECVDVCRSIAGAFGTTNHPDCARATATCTAISPGLPYGKCR